MVFAAFVAPYLLGATMRFVEAAAGLPDTELALITCDPESRVPDGLRPRLAAHWRIDDPFDAGQIAAAAEALGRHVGPVQRLFGVLEQLQVPLGQVREHLGIAGMDAATARNFRDKAQMKSVLRAAGVPCARYRLADSADAAAGFAAEAGFPLVVKPPAGAGAKSTFRLDDAEDLRVWLSRRPAGAGPARAGRGVPHRRGGLVRQRDDRTGRSSGTRSRPTSPRRWRCCATRGSSGGCSCRAT